MRIWKYRNCINKMYAYRGSSEMDNLLMNQVESDLLRIIKSRFNIDFKDLGREYFCKDLLDREIGLAARDLLYIYFDIIKEFNITIPEEDILQGKFSTINGLIDIVVKQMSGLKNDTQIKYYKQFVNK